jgi:hypothetical protein
MRAAIKKSEQQQIITELENVHQVACAGDSNGGYR